MKIKNVTLTVIASGLLLFFYYQSEKTSTENKNQPTEELSSVHVQKGDFSAIFSHKEKKNLTTKGINEGLQEKDTINTVSLDTAEVWTAAWRDSCKSCSSSFLVPAVDLIEVLNEMGIISDSIVTSANTDNQGVRIYMGIEGSGKSAINKLLIVGTVVDSTGVNRDIINGTVDGKGSTSSNTTSGIFDFTQPCPNTCDDESPLNGD